MLLARKVALTSFRGTGSYGSKLEHGAPPMYRRSFRGATIQRHKAAAGIRASRTAGSPAPPELATQGLQCPATDHSSVNNIVGASQIGAAVASEAKQEAEGDSLRQELEQLQERAVEQALLIEQQQQTLQTLEARMTQQRQQQLWQRRQRQVWQPQAGEGDPTLGNSATTQPAPACQLWLPGTDSSPKSSRRLADDFDARFPSNGS